MAAKRSTGAAASAASAASGEAPENDVLVIRGRTFRPATRFTTRQRNYLLSQIGRSRLAELPGQLAATDEAAGVSLMLTFLGSPVMPELLAGLVVEDGEVWSLETAAANATLFGDVDDPAEQAALDQALLRSVQGFFSSAGLGLMTSPRYLAPDVSHDPARRPISGAQANARPSPVAGGGGAEPTSATSTR
jgi:hypothetical protein